MDALCLKISNSVDQLAVMLDHLYKLSTREREDYYEKIQSCKNKLVGIKSNLRHTNLIQSEKAYHQAYLHINQLKNQIEAKANLKSKPKTSIPKHQSSSLNDSMHLLVQKEQQVIELKNKLENMHQQLITLRNRQQNTREELIISKKQIQQLKAITNQINHINTQQQIEISKIREYNRKLEDQIRNLKINDINSVELCQQATNDIRRYKQRLIDMEDRCKQFEKQRDNNIVKIRTLQDSANRYHKQNLYQIQNYQMKEKQHIRKISQLEKYIEKYLSDNQRCNELEQEKRRASQDIQFLQLELKKVTKALNQNTNNIVNQQILIDKLNHENNQLNLSNERLRQALNNKQCFLQNIQKAINTLQITISQKNQLITEAQIHINELQRGMSLLTQQNHSLNQKLNHLEHNNMQYKRQINILIDQNKKYKDQYNRVEINSKQLLQCNRNLRIDLEKITQIYKNCENQKQKLIQQLIRLKNYQNEYQVTLKRIQNDQNKLFQIKNTYQNKVQEIKRQKVKLEEQHCNLKRQFLRAKIQTLHNIKQLIL